MPARKTTKQPKDKLLPRLTIFFFDKPVFTGLTLLVILLFGALSYTTFLRREGFPSVNIPLTIVSGTYLVNDSAKVDNDVAKPLGEIALKQANVTTVQTQSAGNFFQATVQYKEGTDAKAASADLEKAVKDANKLPPSAQLQYNVPNFGPTGGDIQKIDVAISFYPKDSSTDTVQLAAKAEAAAKWLNDQHLPNVKTVFVKSPYEQVNDPITGEAATVQRSFDRYGVRENNDTKFYDSVIIGVTAEDGTDVIKLDNHVHEALTKLQQQPEFEGYGTAISASFAPSIKDNLGELQRVLLEGLLAILVVGSIVIAIRASIITVFSMITVLLATLGFLYLIGYTLNVITLFALILGLALIVDDTIIMVEAIDAARRKQSDRRKIVQEATRKISRAMVAATATAALSFAPLLFVGGILGAFIRAIPVTLISALIISLFVALVFIPFMARFLLLGKKQVGKKGEVKEVAAGFEAKLAHFITKPMTWAQHSRKRLMAVILTAIFIGLAFIGAGMGIASKVVFNIFPPTKDTNGIVVSLQLPPTTTIEQAEQIAADADKLTAEVVGDNFVQSSYYATGTAQGGTNQIEIISYSKRDITSPELVKQLQSKFDKDFKEGIVAVGQSDIGPPSSAFVVQIDATNRQEAFNLANDMAKYLETAELKRPSGKIAHFTNVTVSNPSQYIRNNGKPIITVSAGFDGNDTTTLVTLGQDAVKQEFPDKEVQQKYGVPANAISFDLGQESENQDSFKTLALAFPILLVVIFILLAFEFRSLLQPLLIFMAIPFSIFGVMLGLYLTDNAISFFAMLGFFALVGLSIKNTILLTDYANQARRSGLGPIEAAAAALEERFRPLFATSMTAVVSLIPLAISSPFWEGLAVVLIFGLLSSTFLVLTVFPYYYIAAEYTRLRVTGKQFALWFVPTLLVTILLVKITGNAALIPAVFIASLVAVYVRKRLARV